MNTDFHHDASYGYDERLNRFFGSICVHRTSWQRNNERIIKKNQNPCCVHLMGWVRSAEYFIFLEPDLKKSKSMGKIAHSFIKAPKIDGHQEEQDQPGQRWSGWPRASPCWRQPHRSSQIIRQSEVAAHRWVAANERSKGRETLRSCWFIRQRWLDHRGRWSRPGDRCPLPQRWSHRCEAGERISAARMKSEWCGESEISKQNLVSWHGRKWSKGFLFLFFFFDLVYACSSSCDPIYLNNNNNDSISVNLSTRRNHMRPESSMQWRENNSREEIMFSKELLPSKARKIRWI